MKQHQLLKERGAVFIKLSLNPHLSCTILTFSLILTLPHTHTPSFTQSPPPSSLSLSVSICAFSLSLFYPQCSQRLCLYHLFQSIYSYRILILPWIISIANFFYQEYSFLCRMVPFAVIYNIHPLSLGMLVCLFLFSSHSLSLLLVLDWPSVPCTLN